jgi:hypothetical protein
MSLLLLQVLTMNLRSAALAGQPLPPPESELDYPSIINRALPDDIRVLGWTDVPNPDFDARCACAVIVAHVQLKQCHSSCLESQSPLLDGSPTVSCPATRPQFGHTLRPPATSHHHQHEVTASVHCRLSPPSHTPVIPQV